MLNVQCAMFNVHCAMFNCQDGLCPLGSPTRDSLPHMFQSAEDNGVNGYCTVRRRDRGGLSPRSICKVPVRTAPATGANQHVRSMYGEGSTEEGRTELTKRQSSVDLAADGRLNSSPVI